MGTAATPRYDADLVAPVRTVNALGQGPFAIVCDHASNRIPPAYGDLGLPPSERIRHIAWDPGALAVSLQLSHLLDAPLVHATTSRLIVDCNRFTDSDSLMPEVSEYTEIPGNKGIGGNERAERIARYWVPFHDAVDRVLAAVDLDRLRDHVVEHLSGGERGRVSLAVAMLGNPRLLVLDEPTVGLDPVLRESLWQLFHRLAADGAAVLVSSHVMDEAQRCDELLLMRDGRLLAQAPPSELMRRTGTDSMEDAFLRLVDTGEGGAA